MRLWPVCVALGLALTACARAVEPSADDVTERASGDADVLVGAFTLSLEAPSADHVGFTSFVGKVFDGPTPSLVVWEQALVDEDCALLTPRIPFCDAPCGGAACVEDDTCEAFPTSRSVGDVDVSGLRVSAFTAGPTANSYQAPLGMTLPFPAFDEDAVVVVRAAGAGGIASFELEAAGIAPLVLDDTAFALADATPLKLTWAPPMSGASRVRVQLDVSHHGGTKGIIRCDTDDDGALTLGASMLDALRALGIAGFPTVVVERVSTGSTVIAAGRVDLMLISRLEHAVDIAGLTSCTDDDDCEGATTCQSDLVCR